MQEDFFIEKLLKGKTEEEIEQELMHEIIETREKLINSINNFEYAEEGLVDYFSYQIKANQAKFDYLTKIAKRIGMVKKWKVI